MINIITALKCEAKPLIEALQLSFAGNPESFPLYNNAGINLLVAGVGKTSITAACETVHKVSGSASDGAWLNVGIAGHKSSDIGCAYLVNKVSDKNGGNPHFPYLPEGSRITNKSLVTVAEPCENYRGDNLYDMEASAFFSAAMQYSSRELVQSIKIVSDNSFSSTRKINKSLVHELIQKNIEPICEVVQLLGQESDNLRKRSADPEHYSWLVETYHFSQYQRNELRKLLRKRASLGIRDSLDDIAVDRDAASRILGQLRAEIETGSFSLLKELASD